jgi:hypothetical protein
MFIEAIGLTFDCFAHDPHPFFANFDGSFLCYVLRQFFFSPLLREFVGEQFTIFFDFLSCMKRSDGVAYPRIQRCFSLFLNELRGPIPTCPFLRALFRRISREFEDKSHCIMVVIIYAVLMNMMLWPTCYAVLPLTSNYSEETAESVRVIKFYCAHESHLPIPDSLASFTPIAGHDGIDYQLVQAVVDDLLAPGEIGEMGPEMDIVTMPLAAAQFLAQFEEGQTASKAVDYAPEQLVSFVVAKAAAAPPETNREFALVAELMNNVHPDAPVPLTPRCEAIRRFLGKQCLDYSKIAEIAVERCEACYSAVIALQTRMVWLERAYGNLKSAIAAADTQFVNAIANGIMRDSALMNELEKKKNTMKSDSSTFTSFFVSHMDAFAQKNQGFAPFLAMIARRFHAMLMTNFPLSVMSEDAKQRHVDRLFLARKMKLLASLERTGIDSNVERIIKSKEIFSHAQQAVLRACLFENPVESATQIVLSLFVVEDLFVAQFGCPPEANQLMPLLANLFILSPMPTPLSFGRWLSHFFQPLMQAKPEWFDDESLRPLEHYFQFNEWMATHLDAVSRSESLDSI